MPSPIHAGGLRYHGMAPLVSHAVNEGYIKARALSPESECFDAGLEVPARTKANLVAAPESSHALAQARREAMACVDSGEGRSS